MRFLITIILIAIIGGGYYYYNREGSAERAGAVVDEALDKGKRIIDIVNE